MHIDLLELAALTATGAGPLYRQVKLELQRAIESGRCRLGQALPNETAIARALDVSVGTLRRAEPWREA